jgi:hypothetical protein
VDPERKWLIDIRIETQQIAALRPLVAQMGELWLEMDRIMRQGQPGSDRSSVKGE